jgi:hypothetical protein
MRLRQQHRPYPGAGLARWALAAVLAAATLASGCAHVQVDADGRTHVRGLVWLTLQPPPAEHQAAHAGQGLRLRALGLSMLRSDVGTSLVLGWQDSNVAYLLDHKMVDARLLLNPVPSGTALAADARPCAATTGETR